jgi:CheY-like chemotaxis protein
MKSELRILIIDDEAPIRQFLRAFLEMSGHAVIEADNGRRGCQAAQTHRPHLIICDGNMPVMDGMTTLKTVRALPEISSTPFIFLTANDCNDRRREAERLGAQAYVLKPVDLGVLGETIDRALAETACN